MKKTRPWIVGAFCVFFFGAFSVRTHAQEGAPAPTNVVAPRDDASQSRFFWCEGVADAGDLDVYTRAGFNTLVVPLPWRTDEGGEVSEATWGPQRALALEGAKRGLKIIFSLPAAPQNMSTSVRVGADSRSYAALWTNWAQSAVASLQSAPNLVGWMLPSDARGLMNVDDLGFRRYLQSHFASIDVLNARWETRFDDFDSVSVEDVATLSSAWKARQSATSSGAPLAYGAVPTRGAGLWHPAALALADFKRESFSSLVALWASTLRGADARRLVFSGACPDYAQLLAMPEGVDVSVAAVAPSVAEPDVVTHNPQSLDIARRGGTHHAVARLTLRPGSTLPQNAIGALLSRWVDAAVAHGSRGVAFDSFDALERNPALLTVVSQSLVRLKAERDEAEAPLATCAVLLDALAEGTTIGVGDEAAPLPRGLYGFGDDLVEGEPSNLVASLRWGTAFGSVDYLSPDDLARVDVARYSTILAPQLLDCSPETARRLSDYVREGGVLVADLGLGALQNGGSPRALPPSMALLAGGVGPFDLRGATFNLRGSQGHPLFPTWERMLEQRPGMALSLGEGRDSSAFDGLAGFAPVAPNARVLALGPASGPNRVALSLAGAGRGFFVFAPFRMWTSWRPGHLGFDSFHGDLLARGAALAVPTDALTPFPVGSQLGSTRFPEVVNRGGSLTFLNHDAASGAPRNVAVETGSVGDWLWSNALVRLSNAGDVTPGLPRTAPIDNPTDLESRPRPMTLFSSVAPGARLVCRMRSIALQNLGGGNVSARIEAETPASLAIRAWGDTLQIAPDMNGNGWQPIAPDGTENFRLTVVDSPGGYRCPPNSRHRVTIEDLGVPVVNLQNKATKKKPPFVGFVVADARGRMQINYSGASPRFQLAPVSLR